MAKKPRELSQAHQERIALAEVRIANILRRHTVASLRTMEQKISDAGPYGQRCDPHIITSAKKNMLESGVINRIEQDHSIWFHLPTAPTKELSNRISEQLTVLRGLQEASFTLRVGQSLEIAIYRALGSQTNLDFFGAFLDLDNHDDSTLYKKDEPPSSINGKTIHPRNLDFLVHHPKAGWAGIEAKNEREWLYPRRKELTELIQKCLELDCIPVLIGRRIPFVTFKIFSRCGMLFHQMYNQILPATEQKLADRARHKNNLGYHDIRVGNLPDRRLIKFIGTNLPSILEPAREAFELHKDLLTKYASGNIDWSEFAARVRRRAAGTNEDHDWDEKEEEEDWPDDEYSG